MAAVILVAGVVGFGGELAFRGHIMERLDQACGMPIPLTASSILFGLVHTLNPNVTVLGIGSFYFSGLLHACAYLVTRSLGLPMGLQMRLKAVETAYAGLEGKRLLAEAGRGGPMRTGHSGGYPRCPHPDDFFFSAKQYREVSGA